MSEIMPESQKEIVFVENNVLEYEKLIGEIKPGTEIHVLDAGRDGLKQIADVLASRTGIDAVHLVSHGSSGELQLGSLNLISQNLSNYADELATIKQALSPDADILLYGCDVANGTSGAAFIQALADFTQGDIAASNNLTGTSTQGGDWVLERHTGTIEAGLFAAGGAVFYGGLLAAPTTETFNGVTVDGGGHSFGTPGQPRTINGWTFTMLGANGSADTGINSYIDVTNVASETSLANDGADHAAALSGTFAASTGQAAAVLAATSGEEFAFQSIVVENYQSGGTDYRLVGYRNGSAVSGATQDFTAGTYPDGGTLVTVSGGAWQNLDEVRIVRQSGQTDISIFVDDITVAAIVRPTATVVVADTALTAGETSGVTFTFSQAVTGFTNADLTIANGTLTNVTSSDSGVTWTATFTPTAGITDATNVISVNMAGVSTVTSSVAGTGTQNSNNYTISTVRPTAGIVVADNALSIGETSGVTITFSEAVTGFTNADLSIANGTLSSVSSSDGGVTWTATLTPTASTTDATNVITLDNTGVTNADGNTGSGTTNSNNYAIDTARPTASIVVADTSLTIGETSLVTITFSEAVTGFTNADLTIDNGTLSAVSSSNGGVTWTATFTPTASTTDATNLITLDNTGVTDLAGNAGSGSTDSNNYAIDTVRPTASIVVADTSLTVGETSGVTITFSEAVTGFTNADLTVANGTLSPVSSSNGGVTWTATLTPSASTTDATNLITLDNTGVTDLAGNAGSGSTDSNNYAIDTARPTASIVVADNALSIGETSLLTITFSEAVTGFTNADLSIENGTLSAVGSSDGGITWTATLTPSASTTDATNLITLDNTGVTDAAGNAGSGSTDSNNYAIDATRPTASIVVADTALLAGETSGVTITFSEAVTGFTNADLTVANGTLSAVSSGDGGISWTATLTPTASISDTTNLITLDNTGVTDVAGNAGSGTTDSNNYAVQTVRPTVGIAVADSTLTVGETSLVTITFSEAVTGFTNADLTIANGTLSAVSSSDGGITWMATLTPTASTTDATNLITLDNTGVTNLAGNAGSGSTDSNNYAIDTVRPTASIVVADTSLTVGETSGVTITFSEAVTGFTNADLTVANGTLSAVSSSNGGVTWTATLTPSASTTDATNLITLDNTGVTDLAGNAGSGSTDSNNYAIDTARPTASIVVADNALSIGETSLVTITFSEAVTGFTNADLTIANGTLSAVSSSNGGVTWTATLTPSASTTDATNLITLDNTGVTDAAGNAGSGSTDSNNYAIDTARPLASVSMADTALALGETSLVTITFSEAVTGFTNADLTVSNGTLSPVSSSNGGVTWTTTFTPISGITASTNLITLSNSGVADLAGNTGTGSANSANYQIDTIAPTATLVVDDSVLAFGDTSGVTVTFSEAVTGFTNADLSVANGSLSAVSTSDGGTTWTAILTPTANTEDATNLITLANTSFEDLAGNIGSGTTDSNNYVIDNVAPAFASAAVNGSSLVLTYTEAGTLDAVNLPAASAFSVLNGVTPITVSSVAANAANHTLTLTLAAAVGNGDNVTVAYTDPTGSDDVNAIQDSVGNDAANLAATAVSNNTPAPNTPSEPPANPPPAKTEQVDGVTVTTSEKTGTTSFTDPVTGTPQSVSTISSIITVPIVEASRQDVDRSTSQADIPLAQANGGAPLISASVPIGVGLSSEALIANGNSPLTLRQLLIAESQPRAETLANFQEILDQGIDRFVPKVTDASQVTVRTVTFTSSPNSTAPTQPIVINGATGTGENDAAHPQRQEALIIDVRNLPVGTQLQLNNVEFAIIIGATRVQGGNGQNFVVGDNDVQFIVLGADDDILHGGPGNDTIGSLDGKDQTFGDAGNDTVYGGADNDQLSGGSGNDALNGGFGFDLALQSGSLADYQISKDSNGITLTNSKTGEQDHFTDVEQIHFDTGPTLTVAYSQGEAVAAHLVGTWLARDLTPDEGAYVQQFLSQTSPNSIVDAFLTLPEAQAKGLSSHSTTELLAGFNTDANIIIINTPRDFTGSAGNEQGYPPFGLGLNIDGGAGFDTLKLQGQASDYHLAHKGNVLEITQLSDGAMLNLSNAEWISFDNGKPIALAHNNVEAILGRLVHTFLNRDVSPSEWQLGTAALQTTQGADQILDWFQANANLQNLSNADYLKTIYQNTYDRMPTSTELSHYQPTLDQGSLNRNDIAIELAASPEAISTVGSVMTFEGWV